MRKKERHLIIKEIIQTKVIRTQEELLHELKSRKIDATQATISRDIRELKIVKKSDNNGSVRFELLEPSYGEEISDHQELFTLINESVVKIDTAQFLTVIHTLANNAQILSAALDDVSMEEKMATIAGFDTVVVISKTIDDALRFTQLIKKHMNI